MARFSPCLTPSVFSVIRVTPFSVSITRLLLVHGNLMCMALFSLVNDVLLLRSVRSDVD